MLTRLARRALLPFAWLLTACGNAGTAPAGGGDGGPPDTLDHPRLYNAACPFNQRIGPDPALDPRSAELLGSVLESAAQGFGLAWNSWAVPVYTAGANTPRRTVRLTADWAPRRFLRGVPLPDYARPDPEDDGHICVIDPDSGCEYDLWQARFEGGEWSASWANSIRIDGDGVYPAGFSCRGSGFALLAGVIWPDELRAGRIDHALAMIYDFIRAGGPVPPATESDGEVVRPDALPEGARLQLDPELDLATLGLRPFERAIARAMQEYGLIVVDSGGGVAFQAVHPFSVQGNPYAGLWPADEDPVDLTAIPLDRLRVLRLPAQVPEPRLELIAVGCAAYE